MNIDGEIRYAGCLINKYTSITKSKALKIALKNIQKTKLRSN